MLDVPIDNKQYLLVNVYVTLESRNFINKQLSKLEIENVQIMQSQEEILNKTKLFYETLYQKNETLERYNLTEKLKHWKVKKLTDQESKSLEGPVTKAEV